MVNVVSPKIKAYKDVLRRKLYGGNPEKFQKIIKDKELQQIYNRYTLYHLILGFLIGYGVSIIGGLL